MTTQQTEVWFVRGNDGGDWEDTVAFTRDDCLFKFVKESIIFRPINIDRFFVYQFWSVAEKEGFKLICFKATPQSFRSAPTTGGWDGL